MQQVGSIHRPPRRGRALAAAALLAAATACASAPRGASESAAASASSGTASSAAGAVSATATATSRVGAASAPAGGARIAMLNLAFYGKRANSLEPGDPLLADEGTLKVRTQILDSDGVVLLDSATVAAAAASPRAMAAAQGKPCNVVMACARAVGQELGVPWVVTGKISKTSNLIWIFTGQLIDVATGELVMDDEYELKGDAHDMVAAGSRAFARRVVRKVGGEPRS